MSAVSNSKYTVDSELFSSDVTSDATYSCFESKVNGDAEELDIKFIGKESGMRKLIPQFDDRSL